MQMPITKAQIESEVRAAKAQIRDQHKRQSLNPPIFNPAWELYPAEWGISLRVRYSWVNSAGITINSFYNVAM